MFGSLKGREKLMIQHKIYILYKGKKRYRQQTTQKKEMRWNFYSFITKLGYRKKMFFILFLFSLTQIETSQVHYKLILIFFLLLIGKGNIV